MTDDALLKITINGQEEEIDPQEAAEFIQTGRKTRELEQKYNTSFDKVWPEYNKVAQERAKLEQELAESKAQLTEFSQKQKEGIETSEDVVKAREAAKKVGIVLKEDLDSSEFIKKGDLDKYFDERKAREQQVEGILKEADKLETQLNGEDGRPKFNKKAILAYASAYGFSDLNAAYEDMHSERLNAWKQAQIDAQKAKSLKTLKANGEKAPKEPRVTDSNFKEMLRESLYSNNE